ncbi:metal-dependent transcriptional regulator [Candidatus Micrarchaeota archaeon]|nr:metal-dependent transcriptional regulator [Candidatus Micrarchaeota archaeon]
MKNKTIEEYCRLIDKLDQGEGVRSALIANNLKLSKNTVALTLQKLANEKFIEMKRYGKVRLTAKGNKIAKNMNFKHRVLEAFFFSKLKMDKMQVHREADAIEHWASDEMVNKLYRFIGKPKTDPHGKEIR